MCVKIKLVVLLVFFVFGFFDFCTPKKLHTTGEAPSLSEQIDDAWNVCTHSKSKAQKKVARKFLAQCFKLDKEQNKSALLEKIEYLIRLKQENPETIPSFMDLPNDTNSEVVYQRHEIEVRCIELLSKIRALGFGEYDTVMETYLDQAFQVLNQLKQLERAEKFLTELINIYAGLRRDPVTCEKQQAMQNELAALLAQPNLMQSYVEAKHAIYQRYAEEMQTQSIMLRASNGYATINSSSNPTNPMPQ